MSCAAEPVGRGVRLAELETDPHETLARLRAAEPVAWVPAIDGWLVTRRDLAIEAMRNHEAFTVDDPRFTTGRVVGPSMLSTDGDDHDRHRAPFVEAFRIGSVRGGLEGWVFGEARRLVRQLEPDGHAELREAFAAPLAVNTVLHCLGLVDVDASTALRWYREIVDRVGQLTSGLSDEAETASVRELNEAIQRTIAVAPDSLLGLAAAYGGRGKGAITAEEVASNAAVIMFGAIETSEGAIANLLFHLLAMPDAMSAVAVDRSLIRNAVEESLRLEPSAPQVDRYATRDVVLGEARISAGDFVAISLAGANRDDSVFSDPDRYCLHRPNVSQHVTFVHGPHACLGIHLARLEMRACLEAVLDVLPNVTLDADSVGPRGLVFRKAAHVNASW